MQNRRSSDMLLFILGVFSETQIRVVGSIGISELFIYVFAPIFFITDYYDLKRHGFMPVIGLATMSCVGCVISSVHNGTPMQLFLRGFAATYSLFAIPVVMHHFLWRNIGGFKFALLGHVISSIITIFIFTSSAELAVTSNTGELSSGQLYYLSHFGPMAAIFLNCFYMSVPTSFSLFMFSLPPLYTLFTTATGRSALLGVFVTSIMVLYAGRHAKRMTLIKRHLTTFLIAFAVVISCVSITYKYLAVNGYLTDEARIKYEGQTKTGQGFLSLIMGGRSEVFIGLIAALDEPIYGHGPWPIDRKGYIDEFSSKYGDMEDYRKRLEWERTLQRTYGRIRQRRIPCHSMIIGNWLYNGILGLPFWIYILVKMYVLMRKSIDTIPQWFGYFAISIPHIAWGIFFSGYGARMTTCWFITAMLLSIAVENGKILLPREMLIERERNP